MLQTPANWSLDARWNLQAGSSACSHIAVPKAANRGPATVGQTAHVAGADQMKWPVPVCTPIPALLLEYRRGGLPCSLTGL